MQSNVQQFIYLLTKPIAYRDNIYLILNSKKMKNLNTMTNEELAISYMEGNNRAFDMLLQRTQDALFTYILFVVHDNDTANDIFQETFVKAIMYLQKGRYTPTGKFTAWMMRIAHKAIMDWYRRQKQFNLIDVNEANDLSNISSEDLLDTSKEADFVNKQVLCDVKKLMEFLPATQREVVFMRYYQEMSFKEIAETTGVSINTSLGRMRYALINMRKLARQNSIELEMV